MTQEPPDPFAPPSPDQPGPPPVQPTWTPAPEQPAWGAQYAYGQYQGQWPAQPPWGAPARTNTCAILALVFSFFCFPAGLVLGIVALSQLKRSQDSGRGLAIAGIVLSSLWVPLIALVVVLAASGAFDDPGVSTGRVARAGTTTVGQCMLSDPSAPQNPVVYCASPHDQEVYAVGRLPSGDYPGDASVTDSADAICRGAFKSYLAISYEDSAHAYAFYVPDEDEWTAQEERRVICVVTPAYGDRDYDSAYHKGE